MRDWKQLLLFFPLLLHTSGEDTVAEDIGVHQLERLVELLTPTECEDLLEALSQPEENIFGHLKRLLPENNVMELKTRVRRNVSPATDSEARCQTALTDWLLKNGEKMFYDRLSRALQHIGRTDIAIEVGKNINQDKVLSLKRYVEDFHKHVSALKSLSGKQRPAKPRKKKKGRKVRDLTWGELDLIVERTPVPLHRRALLEAAWPLLSGMLLGIGGSFLVAIFVLLLTLYISRRGQLRYLLRMSPDSSKSPTTVS